MKGPCLKLVSMPVRQYLAALRQRSSLESSRPVTTRERTPLELAGASEMLRHCRDNIQGPPGGRRGIAGTSTCHDILDLECERAFKVCFNHHQMPHVEPCGVTGYLLGGRSFSASTCIIGLFGSNGMCTFALRASEITCTDAGSANTQCNRHHAVSRFFVGSFLQG